MTAGIMEGDVHFIKSALRDAYLAGWNAAIEAALKDLEPLSCTCSKRIRRLSGDA